MIGGMLADQVDDRHTCPAPIVQIREAIPEARPEMQECARRLFCHARIAVSGSSDNTFKQAEHATYSRDLVKCGHQMNFRCAWVREAGLNARI